MHAISAIVECLVGNGKPKVPKKKVEKTCALPRVCVFGCVTNGGYGSN